MLRKKIKPETVIDRPQLVQDYAGWHFSKMIGAFERDYSVSLDHDAINGVKAGATLTALEKVVAVDGMHDVLAELSGKSDVALVTSSELSRINLCLEVTGISSYFPEDRRYSAHDTLPEPRHKPHPDIYLHALKAEGKAAHEVVAIEDSPYGVASAKAAGIEKIVGYVGATHIPPHSKEASARDLIKAGAMISISGMRDLTKIARALEENIDFSAIKPAGKIWVSDSPNNSRSPSPDAGAALGPHVK